MFSTNLPYNQQAVACIHAFTESTAADYCESCEPTVMEKARSNARAARAAF